MEEAGVQPDQKAQLFAQVELVEPPIYYSSSRKYYKLTQPIKEHIDGILDQNAIKRDQGKSKQQMLGIDIHESLLKQGYQMNNPEAEPRGIPSRCSLK